LDFTGVFVEFYSATLEGVKTEERVGFSDKLQVAEF